MSRPWCRVARGVLVAAVALVAGCLSPGGGPDSSLPPVEGAAPQLVAAYHLVEDGRQQLALGRTDAALATFQKALALAPSSPHANLALAEAKLHKGNARAALIYCDRVSRLTGDDAEWRVRVAALRGQAYEAMGDVARARDAYREALALDARHVEAREGLARLDTTPPDL